MIRPLIAIDARGGDEGATRERIEIVSIEHLYRVKRTPTRAIILGAGFVGQSAAQKLSACGWDTVGLRSKDLDLLAENAEDRLADIVAPGDVLVVVSAQAPVKDRQMLSDNLRMIEPVARIVERKILSHIVYVSSDAVYKDSSGLLNEESCAEPASLHGIMHLSREIIMKEACNDIPLVIVRPSLLYGSNDPHNGYGPNRFWRLAKAGEPISLFGKGEERRDHVHISDVGELIASVVLKQSRGVLNLATGSVISFHDIAEKINERFGKGCDIRFMPRNGPMPHNGYRAFDSTATKLAFPDFCYTQIDDGISRY